MTTTRRLPRRKASDGMPRVPHITDGPCWCDRNHVQEQEERDGLQNP